MLLLIIVPVRSFMLAHNINMRQINYINKIRNPYVMMQPEIPGENTTEPFDYLENIEYDEDEDMWTMDLIIPDEQFPAELKGKIEPTSEIMKDILNKTESETESETPFPSFNEFLRKKQEEVAYNMLQEFNKADEKARLDAGRSTNAKFIFWSQFHMGNRIIIRPFAFSYICLYPTTKPTLSA